MRPWRPRRVLDLEPTRRAVRPSRNIQSFCWVIAHYRQRTQSGRPKGRPHPCSPRHRRLLWRRSHYSLSPVQRRRIARPRASRRTRKPYARLGSRGCWSNAHPAAGCTKSPCAMRISMAPLMLWVDRTGSASGAKASPDSHRPRSSCVSRFTAERPLRLCYR